MREKMKLTVTQEMIDRLEDDVINARDAIVDACLEMHDVEVNYFAACLDAKQKGTVGRDSDVLGRHMGMVERTRRSVGDATVEFKRLNDKLRAAREAASFQQVNRAYPKPGPKKRAMKQ